MGHRVPPASSEDPRNTSLGGFGIKVRGNQWGERKYIKRYPIGFLADRDSR